MQYFISFTQEESVESTSFHEFFRGRWDIAEGDFWNEDSLYLLDDHLLELHLDQLLEEVNSDYDPYDTTEITRAQWDALLEKAQSAGGELAEAVAQLKPWAEDCFRQHEVFTILGL